MGVCLSAVQHSLEAAEGSAVSLSRAVPEALSSVDKLGEDIRDCQAAAQRLLLSLEARGAYEQVRGCKASCLNSATSVHSRLCIDVFFLKVVSLVAMEGNTSEVGTAYLVVAGVQEGLGTLYVLHAVKKHFEDCSKMIAELHRWHFRYARKRSPFVW